MHQKSDVRNSILRAKSGHGPDFASRRSAHFLKRTALLAEVGRVISRIGLSIGWRHKRKGVMYEHRYFVEITLLGPVRPAQRAKDLRRPPRSGSLAMISRARIA
jgi:hypothetical protein